jgi:hypothetical protein
MNIGFPIGGYQKGVSTQFFLYQLVQTIFVPSYIFYFAPPLLILSYARPGLAKTYLHFMLFYNLLHLKGSRGHIA